MAEEKTAWLFGAGFSRPLGGPLFTDLITMRVERWVHAWAAEKAGSEDLRPLWCPLIYDRGVRAKLWSNAEECLVLLEDARHGGLAARVVRDGIHSPEAGPSADLHPVVKDSVLDLKVTYTRFTQFVAIATSHYVPPEESKLPEAWHPYQAWAQSLAHAEQDTILTFNYDHVLDRLRYGGVNARGYTKEPVFKNEVLALHGTNPSQDELIEHLKNKRPVESISVPGPGKVEASWGPEWDAAAKALRAADRLIVIGYSFPASDAYARAFVLKHFNGSQVGIVLGPDKTAELAADMFRRHGKRVVDTQQFAQLYLTDATARSENGRFMHELLWPKRGGVIGVPGRNFE